MGLPRFPVLAALLAWAAVCIGGGAEAFGPAPWRGQQGSSYQEWRFGTDANPATLDVVSNPYGTPVATPSPDEVTSSGWWDTFPVFGTRQGFWDLGGGGTITVDLPAIQYTEIWVEVLYFRDLSVKPVVTVPGGEAIGSESETVETVSPGVWLNERTKWRIPAGTAAGRIVVTADAAWGSVVDRVAVEAFGVVLVVSDLSITPIDSTSAMVKWFTNYGTVGGISYRPVSGLDWTEVTDMNVATGHFIQMTGLVDGVNYAVVVLNDGSALPTIYYPKRWPITGDANLDCTVNVMDLLVVRNLLHQDPASGDNWKADVNGDGAINLNDLITVRNRMGTRCK